jgi:hypothetical protein
VKAQAMQKDADDGDHGSTQPPRFRPGRRPAPVAAASLLDPLVDALRRAAHQEAAQTPGLSAPRR